MKADLLPEVYYFDAKSSTVTVLSKNVSQDKEKVARTAMSLIRDPQSLSFWILADLQLTFVYFCLYRDADDNVDLRNG